jgi:hypothetical protein
MTTGALKLANNHVAALRAEVAYLRSPDRRTGPSRYEAEERAQALQDQADAEDERLFYAVAAQTKMNASENSGHSSLLAGGTSSATEPSADAALVYAEDLPADCWADRCLLALAAEVKRLRSLLRPWMLGESHDLRAENDRLRAAALKFSGTMVILTKHSRLLPSDQAKFEEACGELSRSLPNDRGVPRDQRAKPVGAPPINP